MKKATVSILSVATLNFMIFFAAQAEDKKPSNTNVQLTTADAKKKCKEDGKEGKDLIECIKEKKGDR